MLQKERHVFLESQRLVKAATDAKLQEAEL